MATQAWTADPPLIRTLLEKAHSFSFFQAVQLLERYCLRNQVSARRAARVGYQGPADAEAVRFRPVASLSFPFSDIAAVEKIDPGNDHPPRFRITTTFLGLYGTVSPLPSFYTEDILWKDLDDTCVRDFLDIFHHRLLSLFYRCWSKYRYHIQFGPEGRDEFSRRMFSLVGLSVEGLAGEAGLPAIRLLNYAGLLTQHPRSAIGLQTILAGYFGELPVRIEQCVSRWMRIREQDRNALGQKNCQMKVNLTLGRRVFDRNGKFRICVGPIGWAAFLRFLPEGEDMLTLRKLTQFYLIDKLDFDVKLILKAEEVPLPCLSSLKPATRLGWTSWLASKRLKDDAPVIFH
ncbi:MAG: type VI secretion system baseplate subunit TssG [bacterium]|nr:type VI secretion system baseplate subunit TssG [bacterium]